MQSPFTKSQRPVLIVLHLYWTITESVTIQVKLRIIFKVIFDPCFSPKINVVFSSEILISLNDCTISLETAYFVPLESQRFPLAWNCYFARHCCIYLGLAKHTLTVFGLCGSCYLTDYGSARVHYCRTGSVWINTNTCIHCHVLYKKTIGIPSSSAHCLWSFLVSVSWTPFFASSKTIVVSFIYIYII